MAGSGGYAINTYNIFGRASFAGNLNAAGATMNFYLPTTIAAGGTMLTVTGTVNVAASQVNVGINGASPPLQLGSAVTLIDAGTLTGAPANNQSTGQGMQGVTLLYTFNLATNGKQLLATVAGTSQPPDTNPGTNPDINHGTNHGTNPGVRVNPQAKALSEGFVAAPGLINQTADFVADKGMTQAVAATGGTTPGMSQEGRAGLPAGYSLGGFGAVSGGWNRYNTGSHDDLSSLSLMADLAWGDDLAPGRLTLGAFFEYGNGWYDTYNSFADAAAVHGKGDIYHLGGGILGRMDFGGAGSGNFYTEASIRAGSVHNDYKNGDLRDANGLAANYDSDSAYYGAHVGLGYVWQLTAKAAVDLSGKYFWTRQNGDSVRLSTGDPVRFDNVDSHRLRLGGRFVYAVNGLVNPYVGAAYEQELDGKAKATTNGYAIDTPSLQGGTGIGELGLTLKPVKNLPLSCDLGVQGYAGTREGFTAGGQIRYEF